MNNSEDKEFQFIFKLNKITQLLNYVDAYYQKEILKDIQRYTSSVNQQVQSCNKDVRKTKSFEILNIYLENIINEQLIYLIDVYHKDNKEQIIKNAEKEALKIVNQKTVIVYLYLNNNVDTNQLQYHRIKNEVRNLL